MYPLRRKENKPASLASTVLDLPPCCAEFSPARLELVVGCYLLEEVTKTDTGEESTADEESTLKAQSEEARDDQPGDDDTDLSEPRQRRSGSLVVFKINPGTAKLYDPVTELTYIADSPAEKSFKPSLVHMQFSTSISIRSIQNSWASPSARASLASTAGEMVASRLSKSKFWGHFTPTPMSWLHTLRGLRLQSHHRIVRARRSQQHSPAEKSPCSH